MSNSFRVVSYNIGSPSGNPFSDGFGDHQAAHVWKHGKSQDTKAITKAKAHSEEDQKIEGQAAEKLISLNVDVFLLQEVAVKDPKDRVFTKVLQEKNYELSKVYDRDCVIAVNKDRFKDINDISDPKKGFNAVTAVDKKTGEKVIFINFHLQGFRFNDKDLANAEHAGRGEVQGVLAHLKETYSDYKVQIVGGDFNSDPERLSKVADNRFAVLKNEAFRLKRSKAATNVNPHDMLNGKPNSPERELDFFAVKAPKASKRKKVHAFLFGGTTREFKFEKLNPFGTFKSKDKHDPDVHRSDHLPIFMTYTHKKKSLLSRIQDSWNST